VPAPLGIGTVRLADGGAVKGFICEPAAVTTAAGAQEITHFGGWLAYLASVATANTQTTPVNQ
jgi:allophanate hydrolase